MISSNPEHLMNDDFFDQLHAVLTQTISLIESVYNQIETITMSMMLLSCNQNAVFKLFRDLQMEKIFVVWTKAKEKHISVNFLEYIVKNVKMTKCVSQAATQIK